MLNKRWLIVLIILGLLMVLILSACGDDDGDETPISTSTATAIQTATATATPTAISTSTGPVKIGAIMSFSGPAAVSGQLGNAIIKVVEWQVKQQGGILGGRDIEIVRYDNRVSVAEAIAGATKLYTDDKVAAIVWGGVSGAEQDAIMDFAEEHNILYVRMGGGYSGTEPKVTLSATFPGEAFAKPVVDLVKMLKAETVGFIANDLSDNRARISYQKSVLDPLGIKVVSEDYVQEGTLDFSSFLTKIKRADPDLLIVDTGQNEFVITIAKQIMELGGWGDIEVLASTSGGSAAIKYPGGASWYCTQAWIPDVPNEASKKFVEDYETVNGGPLMNPAQVYYYNALWIAIEAVELAGSDDNTKVAEAVRSGKLEVDLPSGYARFTVENKGFGGMYPVLTRAENGTLVFVEVPE